MKSEIKDKKVKNEEELLEYLQIMKGDLYRIAKARLIRDEDTYDAIQETIIIAYEHIKKGKHIENLKTWIVRVLINECNHVYKREKKQIILFQKKINHNEEEYYSMESIENKVSFDKILSLLKYEDRLIISLYYGSQFTTKEISQILRMNENTIKTRISRAKSKIKEKIERGNMI